MNIHAITNRTILALSDVHICANCTDIVRVEIPDHLGGVVMNAKECETRVVPITSI